MVKRCGGWLASVAAAVTARRNILKGRVSRSGAHCLPLETTPVTGRGLLTEAAFTRRISSLFPPSLLLNKSVVFFYS